jgi:hypothetical protein
MEALRDQQVQAAPDSEMDDSVPRRDLALARVQLASEVSAGQASKLAPQDSIGHDEADRRSGHLANGRRILDVVRHELDLLRSG